MVSNIAGMVGSMVGAIAGLASLVNVLMGAGLTVGAYVIEVVLWALWFTIQGGGFLVLHNRTHDNAALASFILGIIAALVEIGVTITVLSFASITDPIEAIVALLQIVLAMLVGIVVEALYAIMSGVALLHMSRGEPTSSLRTAAGALFIVLGCVVFAAMFLPFAVLIPFLVMAANLLGYLAFSSLGGRTVPKEITMHTSQGIDLQ